jgi:thiamine-monophosphate kinase
LALRTLATAAIDVSDGLLADLGHILDASGLAATLRPPALPPPGLERDSLLAGGDDYELVFTAPRARRDEIVALSRQLSLSLTRLGTTESGVAGDIRVLDDLGQAIEICRRGFDHFV